MLTRELKESTRANYLKTWENRVKDEIGNIKVVQILPSHIKSFYSKLSKAGYAYSTIKFINNTIYRHGNGCKRVKSVLLPIPFDFR